MRKQESQTSHDTRKAVRPGLFARAFLAMLFLILLPTACNNGTTGDDSTSLTASATVDIDATHTACCAMTATANPSEDESDPVPTNRCNYCGGSGRCSGAGMGVNATRMRCHGSGKCNKCGGKGTYTVNGHATKCARCHGSGKCKYCHGSGKCEKCHGRGEI